MLTFLRRLTQPPEFPTIEQTQMAQLIHRLLLIGVVLSGSFATLVRPLANEVLGPQIAGGMTIVFAFLLILLQFGYLNLVKYVLVTTTYLAIGIALIFNGGLRDEAGLIFVAWLALVGFFMGEQATLVLGLVTAVGFIGLFIAERTHLIAETEHFKPVGGDELVLALIAVFVTTFLLRRMIGRIVVNARQVQEQAAALQGKNEVLQEVQQAMLTAKDEAEKANQTKSNFLSHLSHDLRTPVNSIIGFTDILLGDANLTDAVRIDYLQRIKKNGAYMQVLISDLLDLSRIEAGKLNLYPVKIPLTAFLMEVVMLIQMDLQRKSFQFIYEFGEQLPDFVETDETRLRQILVNLLSNAIKFTPQGSVTFRVRPMAVEPPVQVVRFEIIDTGVGIAEADLERIFEPFEQTGSEELRGKGTGLGLAISRHLVRLLGGKLRAASQLGKGSRFWFDLPFSIE